jgi:hypothetical protein
MIALFFAFPQFARADDDCGPIEATQAIVTVWGGGTLVQLGGDLADGLRATDYPSADTVYGAPLPAGEFAVVYVVANRACRARILSQSEYAALAALSRRGESLAGPSL